MARQALGPKDLGFWQDKTPCWEMCHCPDNIRETCPAPKYPACSCWEIEGTYLKLTDSGNNGDDISICQVCRVFKKYGDGKPIRLRLLGKGIDAYLRNLKQKSEMDEPESPAQSQKGKRTPRRPHAGSTKEPTRQR